MQPSLAELDHIFCYLAEEKELGLWVEFVAVTKFRGIAYTEEGWVVPW